MRNACRATPREIARLNGLEWNPLKSIARGLKKVGKVGLKVAKYGAIAAVGVGAAGLAVRGGRFLLPAAGKLFRAAAGRRLPGGAPAGGGDQPEAMGPPAPSYTPSAGPSYSPPQTTSSGGGGGGGETATQAESGAAPLQAGMNPAMIVGALVLGGIFLATRRKGRA
jgi:hypothetical protein